MNPNAYLCFECDMVAKVGAIEGGSGQWVSLKPLSLCLVVGSEDRQRVEDTVIRGAVAFCSPDCVIAAMTKVKRV